MRTNEEFRELMRQRIQQKNWCDLFTAGACYFFALVLHEELKLPLFYATQPDSTGFEHVFVKRGEHCIDYCGKRPIGLIAKLYAGWPDEPLHETCPGEIKKKIKEKGFGEDLEKEIYDIAKREFNRRREIYL